MGESLNIDEIEDRFFVYGRMEILNVLNDLIHRCEPLTVDFGGVSDRLHTRLLEARDTVLIFDLGEDSEANARLLKCQACSFVAYPDGIRVQFAAHQVRQVSWGGSPAFCIPLPERVARVQRQESYRILIAPAQKVVVRLFSSDGAGLGEWPLHDLSVGGLGLAVPEQASLALGKTISRIGFSLPGHGEIECSVALRHATDLVQDQSNPPYRIGLMFCGLPPAMGVAIQRYIIEQEHERRSQISGYDADGFH